MALSDCPKCWETLRVCGHEYKEYSIERKLSLINAIIGDDSQQAIALAATIIERCVGWLPVKDIDRHIVDRTPMWLKFEDDEFPMEHAVYANYRFYDMWGNLITGRISHYMLITKPAR